MRVAFFAALCWLLGSGAAQAQVTLLDGLEAPIVRVNLAQGDITIRTWDRSAVSVDGDSSLLVERRTTQQSGEPFSLPVPRAQSATPEGHASLPAESFVLASIPAGPREAITIRSPVTEGSAGLTPVTVTVPNSAVFVFAHTNGGSLDIRDYRGGTLFATSAHGRVSLTNVGGAVFAQSTHGPLVVADSSFDRIRARSLTGNLTFERCRARQIEATSVNGSIVYDAGTFEPGLARFESTRGDVAVGTSAAAEIGAHAGSNARVYTNFDHAAKIDGRDGETSAVVGGGGPVVTANSQAGNVYLYDGSLRTRGAMSGEWDGPLGALQRPAERAPHTESRAVQQLRGQYPPFNAPLPRDTGGRPNQAQSSAAPHKWRARRNARRPNQS